MSWFVVGLTNEDPSVTAPVFKRYRYRQYRGRLPVSATAAISFGRTAERFRHVVIHRNFRRTNAICIAEVRVFLRGRT